MRWTRLTAATVVCGALLATPIATAEAAPVKHVSHHVSKNSHRHITTAAKRMAAAKNGGLRQIGSDLAAASRLAAHLPQDKHLSEAMREALAAKVDSEIAALTALRDNVAGDTTLADVLADVAKAHGFKAQLWTQLQIAAEADRLVASADATRAAITAALTALGAASGLDATTVAALQDKLAQASAALDSAVASAVAAVSAALAINSPDAALVDRAATRIQAHQVHAAVVAAHRAAALVHQVKHALAG